MNTQSNYTCPSSLCPRGPTGATGPVGNTGITIPIAYAAVSNNDVNTNVSEDVELILTGGSSLVDITIDGDDNLLIGTDGLYSAQVSLSYGNYNSVPYSGQAGIYLNGDLIGSSAIIVGNDTDNIVYPSTMSAVFNAVANDVVSIKINVTSAGVLLSGGQSSITVMRLS